MSSQFFIGRELNPPFPISFPFSTAHMDLKSFNELRPGLILWLLVDISCACAQHVKLSALTNSTEKVALGITDSMWLVLVFQGWYIFDGLYNEVCLSISVLSIQLLSFVRSRLSLVLWISLPTVSASCWE